MNRGVKAGHAHNILKNQTYTKESGLYQNLFKALMKLPGDQLANLDLIVGIKETDAADASRDPQEWAKRLRPSDVVGYDGEEYVIAERQDKGVDAPYFRMLGHQGSQHGNWYSYKLLTKVA